MRDTSLMGAVPVVPTIYVEMCTELPLKLGHLSNPDSVNCPSYIEMCTKLPLK